MTSVRETWRLALLLVLLVGSVFALFGPGIGTADAHVHPGSGDVTTNLAYGIELDGGARVRGTPDGITAVGVTFGNQSPAAIDRAVTDDLGLDPLDVVVSAGARTADGKTSIEARASNVSRQAFVDALESAGVGLEDATVRRGVTQATRSQLVSVIESRIRASALSGGDAWQAENTFTGTHYIVVEAPNQDVADLRSLISQRGVVRVEAYYPQGGNWTNRTVLRQGDFQRIGPGSYLGQNSRPGVSVTVREDVARNFSDTMVDIGFGQAVSCNWQGYGQPAGDGCLLVVSDGQVYSAFGIRENLASSFTEGSFSRDPTFSFETRNISAARELSVQLNSGALPAPLNVTDTVSVAPGLASQFKLYSLVTGVLAVVAVSVVVFFRYGDARVAAPMVVTALSEVVLLLGFAAAVGYPLDLSVMAGFIAVIGTGVDDLIIIADEVMSEGDVNSSRVFHSRFRKALWVIGAAAATTILAMSPLAFLSLGDLQGFAIITILGVLIGVLITRPAYGDILRTLLTDN